MARVLEHREALRLRKEGKSYSQIKTALGISKSTLSDWLHKYPLTREQINSLRSLSEKRIERYSNTMRRKREERHRLYYTQEKEKWFPFSERELFIAGLFLYWGEGNKADRNVVSVSNTDPSVIKFAINWIINCLYISRSFVRIQLHLYSDMDINEETDYWARQLDLNKNQFCRPYIKESKKTSLDQKGLFGHGTCNIRVCKTEIKERILMDLKAVSDIYSRV
jgi:hypothetical protein